MLRLKGETPAEVVEGVIHRTGLPGGDPALERGLEIFGKELRDFPACLVLAAEVARARVGTGEPAPAVGIVRATPPHLTLRLRDGA